MIGPGIVLAALMVSVCFTLFYLIKSKHLETMARIEHGIANQEDGPAVGQSWLNIGLFLCFLSCGLFTAYLLEEFTSIPNYFSIPGCLLLFGGLGLIVGHFVHMRNVK